MTRKLFILSGGPGKERAVSLSSGKNVMEIMDSKGISYEAMIVNQDKSWLYQEGIITQEQGIEILKEKNALVLEVIHGSYGEDGELVSLLEKNSIPFIGSSSSSMRLTIDKYKTEKKLKEENIATTESVLIEELSEVESMNVTFPAFIKPKDEGSSVSLFKVNTQVELKDVLEKSIPVHGAMLIQPFIVGREFTCGVVEINSQAKALIPTEVILTKGEVFDYEAKYTMGGSKEVTPAEVDQEITQRIQNLALQVHTLCGCKDISRTDMIMKDDGELVVLEINTIPGMTKTSFIPAQLEASGYSVADFVRGMLEKYSK